MSVDANILTGDLAGLQRRKLGCMLGEVVGRNPFYTSKLDGVEFDPATDLMGRLPFTVRKELEAGQAERGPYGTNLTYELGRYCRYHQTSGSAGRPLRWLDTAESWAWFKGLWGVVLGGAGVKAGDRVCFPFSFGPFIGFWGGFEACVEMGCLTLPAGGMASSARLKMIVDNRVDAICCTPTYALHLLEVAREEKIDVAGGSVRKIIVAGEPGGSVPAIKRRLESGWNARVFDHHGMTEMGGEFHLRARRGAPDRG